MPLKSRAGNKEGPTTRANVLCVCPDVGEAFSFTR